MSGRTELARGWRVILASMVGVGVGLTGLPFYSFGVFMKPLSESFGWDRGAISLGMMCLSAGSVLPAPFIGRLIDKWGVREIALASLAGMAIALALLSRTGPSIASFYLGLLLVAALGCGTTPLIWTRSVSTHFDKARGLALGLMLMGTGLASVLGPPLLQMAITAGGVSAGYLAMAIFVAVVALPLAAWGIKGGWRERAATVAANGSTAPLSGMRFREAVATTTFWKIATSIFLVILCQSSVTVHLVPLLSDGGVPMARAASIAGLLGVAIIVGRIAVGLLIDRFYAPHIAALFFTLPALALALLYWRTDMTTAIPAVIILGLAAGAEVDLLAYIVGRFFGLRAYGAIYGTQLSLFGIGAGLGPPLTGWVYDAGGSYGPALIAGMMLFPLSGLLIARLGPYPAAGATRPPLPRSIRP
ncbi:MAG: MFS transporter [Novosphingobium sp.]|nr:MFS transporter [Novosphingobium sp.]